MSNATEPTPNLVAQRADEIVIAKLRECETRARVLATEVHPNIPGAQVLVERDRLEERRYRQLAEAAPRIFAEFDRLEAFTSHAEDAALKGDGRG